MYSALASYKGVYFILSLQGHRLIDKNHISILINEKSHYCLGLELFVHA